VNVKKYQNGGETPGNDPILDRLNAEQLAYDYGHVIEQAMRQGIIPDPRVAGAITPDKSYILMLAESLAGAGPLFNQLKSSARKAVVPEIDMASKQAFTRLQQKQIDDRLQNIAGRSLREGAMDESQNVVNVQRVAQDVIDDMKLKEFMDETEYTQLIKEIENRFNPDVGGVRPDSPEDFSDAIRDVLEKYGLAPKSAIPEIVEDVSRQATQPFFLNNRGGRIRVLKRQ